MSNARKRTRMLGVFSALMLTLWVGVHESRAELYSVTDLGTLGGPQSVATAINNAGQVVGYSYIPGYPNVQTFVYSNGTMRSLGTVSGPSTNQPSGINKSGQVVGWGSNNPNTENAQAFLYSNGTMTSLAPLVSTLGGVASQANAINDAGQA